MTGMTTGRLVHGLVVSVALAAPVPATAQAQPVDEFELSAMIECRLKAETYNAFALWLTGEPGAIESLGWTEIAGVNPFLREFQLPAPVAVFGRSTSVVAFTATGPLGVFDGVTPAEIAAPLGVVALVDTPEKFLGEKVVLEESEEVDGLRYETRVTLNVSTVDTHPGKVFAGCSYSIGVS